MAVRGVGPLGLCFLPAFVLLGVVPAVAGLGPRAAACRERGRPQAGGRPQIAGPGDLLGRPGGPQLVGPGTPRTRPGPGRKWRPPHDPRHHPTPPVAGCVGSPCACAAGDAGTVSAEYAVATVAACGFAGVLYKLLTSPVVLNLLGTLFTKALSFVF